jgi:hypothetical protein
MHTTTRTVPAAALVSHTWQQLVAAVNSAEPINELSVKDVMEEACEAEVRALGFFGGGGGSRFQGR